MTFVKNLQTAKSVQEWSILKRLLFLAALLGYAVFSHGQTTYTWRNTAANSSWNSSANWSPTGVPTASDNVVIVSSTNAPVFSGGSLNNFTLTSGSIDLGGNTLTINGNAVFTAGTISNGRVEAQGTATTFTNGTFNCKIYSSTNNVTINGGTFNDSVVIIKNGTADQSMNGNATFNAPLSIRINSTGRLSFAGNMTFNGVLSLYNAGQDYFILENTTANQYNNDIYLTIAGSNAGDIRLGYGASVTYKGNIYVSSIGGNGDIYLSEGTSYGATLQAGKRIIVGNDGFNSGNLWIQRVTQLGSTPQTISLSGTASLRLGPTTTFNGKINFDAPQVLLNGVTCNDSAFITKTGTSNNTGNGGNTFNSFASITNAATSTGFLRTNGGNVFNGTTLITNSSASEILLDFTTGSNYNGNVIATKNAAGAIRLAYAGTNTFGGNIQLNNLNASSGILFCELAGSTATLANGKTIAIGADGFAVGTLTLQRFTQTGSTNQTINLAGGNLNLAGSNVFNGNLNATTTGTATITVGSGNTFNGKTIVSAPQILLNGSVFNDSAWIIKTGAGANNGSGGNTFNSFASIALASTATGALRTNLGNTFNGTTVLSNASNQELLLEYTGGNVYNADVYVSKTGTGNVRMAYSGATDFNGNIIVSNTNATGGILFGESGTATPNLLSGKSISVGTDGFAVGTLTFTRFTQNGSTTQTLALTGGNLTLGANAIFNGNTNFSTTGSGVVTIQSGAQLLGKNKISFPQVLLNGGTFGDSTWITKTGATANVGAGGAIFNGFASISLASTATGLLRINAGNTYNSNVVFSNASGQELSAEFTSGGTYNGNVYIEKSSTGSVRLAYSGSNVFNGDIIINSSNSGNVLFCEAASSSAVLANGKKFLVGTSGVTAGTITIQKFTQADTTTQNFVYGGNASLNFANSNNFGGNVNVSLAGTGLLTLGSGNIFYRKNNFSAPQVNLNGGTFGDSTRITKTGATANVGAGGAIFNGFASITLASTATGMFRINAGNTYNGTFVFTNASGQELSADITSAGTYNSNVIINKSGTGNVRLAYIGANVFNGDIILNSSSTGGVLFCESAGASATLANGKKFLVGTSGVTAGTITIQKFTQADTTTQNFVYGGNASLNIANSNSFGGNVNVSLSGTGLLTLGSGNIFNGKNNFSAPQVNLNGGSFADSTWITKTGATANAGVGGATFNSFASISLASSATGYFRTLAGNTFNGTLVLNNQSTQELLLDLTSGSNYNGDVILTKTSSGNIRIAYNGSNTFNGNIVVNNTNGTGGIYFCELTSASATLSNGKSFSVGSTGFNAGLLSISRFTQIGSTPQTLSFTGNASLTFGNDNNFNGDVTATLAGTGTLTVHSNNSFNAKTQFTTPQLLLHGAIFGDSSIINKTGAGNNLSSGGNKFLGFAALTNSGTGNLVMGTTNADTFMQKTILTNSNAATLLIANQHSNQTTYFGDSLIISNTSTAATGNPGVRFCENNNTNVYFNGVVIATNAGTGATNLIRFQNGSGETVFNKRAHFNNNCSGTTSAIRVSQNGTTFFNDNAYCAATGGNGISFGNANGTTTFAPTCRILLGVDGYTASNFQINNVKQQGARGLVSLTLSGTTLLTVSNSSFDEEINFTAPQTVFFNDTFNNVVRITKTGATANVSAGGNLFNDSAVITNSSAAALYFASTNADVYNSDVKFVRSGSGAFDPAYNAEVSFNKNIEFDGTGALALNTGGLNGKVILTGDSVQNISGVASLVPSITRLVVNKNAATPAVLNLPVNVAANGSLTLLSGILKTDSANVLTMLNNATANIGNNNAFVDGVLNYQMAAATVRTLVMPIGKDGIYRPVELTVNHNAATNYTYSAQLKNESAAALNRTFSDSINRVSDMRFWKIERLLTSTMAKSNANLQGNQVITLYYDSTDYVEDAANLRIVKNTSAQPNKWISIGGVGSANGKGFITSTSNPSAFNSFSDFTLGNLTGGGNPLPVTLTNLKATAADKSIKVEWATAAEINNKGFEVQRSENGINFVVVGWVEGNGFSTENINYTFEDKKVSPNVLYYYRLKQIDYDEQFEITKVVSAIVKEEKPSTIAWATVSTNSSNDAKLILNATEEGTIEIKTFSSNGALVQAATQVATVGLNQFELSFIQSLQAGTYISTITLNNASKAIKWVFTK